MSNWHNMDIIKNTHTIRIQLVPLLFCHTSSISCFVTNRGHSHAARNILSWPRGDASHWGQQALVSYSPAMSNLGALPLTTSTKFLCYNPLPVCLSKSQAYFAAFPWFLGTHFWFGCHILKPPYLTPPPPPPGSILTSTSCLLTPFGCSPPSSWGSSASSSSSSPSTLLWFCSMTSAGWRFSSSSPWEDLFQTKR